MSKSVHILGHFGLGDHLLCNGLVRFYADNHDRVVIPCYHHNVEAVSFMFRDLKHIEVVGVKDDADAILLCDQKNCLRLGYFNKELRSFNPDIFDQEFYKQARVDFNLRWDDFKVDFSTNPSFVKNIKFIHHDKDRNFEIRPEYYSNYDISTYFPSNKTPFWDHFSYLMNADEIHCINSSFLILADSIREPMNQKLFLHHYARPTKYPKLKRKWEIIS